MSKYKRLNKIVSLIKKNERVIDVGTDHGLIPIFLFKKNITKNITASDINQSPLNFARNNINKKLGKNNIKLILMDGLSKINSNDYDTIIIAGIGGQTISKIIKQKKYNGRYIIHPTTKLSLVRKTLQEIGMKIINEYLIFEGKIYNIIIEAVSGSSFLSKKELFMGPILLKSKDKNVFNYYKFLLNKLEHNVKKSKNENLNKIERIWLRGKIWSEKN